MRTLLSILLIFLVQNVFAESCIVDLGSGINYKTQLTTCKVKPGDQILIKGKIGELSSISLDVCDLTKPYSSKAHNFSKNKSISCAYKDS
jgi:hypothetical protein